MHLLKQRSTVFYVGFVLIMTMAIGGVAFGAFAAGCSSTDTNGTTCGTPSTTSASANIIPGTLSETAASSATVQDASNSNSVTLDGTDQTAHYSFSINVIDARGSGTGWNLMMSATQFSDGTHPVSGPYTITPVTAHCVSGTTCKANSGGAAPGTIGDPTSTSAPVKFWDVTNPGDGMGSWTVTPTVSFTIPANTYAGTYTSNVTVDLIAGP